MRREPIFGGEDAPYSFPRFAPLFALAIALVGCSASEWPGSPPSTTLAQSASAHSLTQIQPEARSTPAVVWNFGGKNPSDGLHPHAALVTDAHGNLYGTTLAGGQYSYGAAVELTPPKKPSGNYTERVLANFTNGPDGGNPQGSLLLVDGKLYGTTSTGGAYGYGTLFELNPDKRNQTPNVLHSFAGYGDGAIPSAGLTYIKGYGGEIVGTTAYGGNGTCQAKNEPAGCGALFLYNVSTTNYSAFYSFNGPNGAYPLSNLTVLLPGNNGCGADLCIVGTTSQGGANSCVGLPQGCGTLFIVASQSGKWSLNALYSFGAYPNDGISPKSGVVQVENPSQGIFAGTTEFGGSAGDGTVFYVVTRDNSPSDLILHSFDPANNRDGANPLGGLVFNSKSGELYGTTSAKGKNRGGTAFKVQICQPAPSCPFETFWNFSKREGIYPLAGFVIGIDGKSLYGTTSGGGSGGGGNGGVANIFHNEFGAVASRSQSPYRVGPKQQISWR